MTFCPLTQKDCRPDCAWSDIQVEIDDEGITEEVFCSITILAAKLVVLDDNEEVI